MSSSKYLQEAIWAQEIIINHLANDNKQLPIRIDCDSGKVIDPGLMVNDFNLESWQVKCLNRLLDMKNVHLDLIILNDENQKYQQLLKINH